MKVKDRRNILVYSDNVAGTANSFNFNLFCPFIPDEVIVSDVTITDDQLATTDTILINSPLVDGLYLFGVANYARTYPIKITFNINKSINGTYTFYTKYMNSTNVVDANISFMLSFVSYEK